MQPLLVARPKIFQVFPQKRDGKGDLAAARRLNDAGTDQAPAVFLRIIGGHAHAVGDR